MWLCKASTGLIICVAKNIGRQNICPTAAGPAVPVPTPLIATESKSLLGAIWCDLQACFVVIQMVVVGAKSHCVMN